MHIPEQDLLKIEQALLTGDDTIEALEMVRKAITARADSALIEQARDKYGSDELEIDEDAGTSSADDGTWVQAWVWLAEGE